MLKEVGERRQLGFEARDHLAIGSALDLIDFDTGAVVAGAKCVPCPALKHSLAATSPCCIAVFAPVRLDAELMGNGMWVAGLCTCGEQPH